MLAVALALLASLTWGVSDFIAGLESRRMTSWAVTLVTGAAAGAGSLVMVAALSPPAPSTSVVLVLVAGGACSATSAVTYFLAMTMTKMSVTSPILAGAAILPVLWGVARGEQPHPLQLIGAAAAIAGIALISRPAPAGPEDEMPTTLKGVLLAVAGSACAGLLVVTLDFGAASDPFWAVMGIRCSAAVWAAVWIAALRPQLRLRRGRMPVLALIGLMIVTANTLFATATTLDDLAVVAVLGWLSPAITIVCARLVLRERLRRVQWVAAATVLAGVVLLVLG